MLKSTHLIAEFHASCRITECSALSKAGGGGVVIRVDDLVRKDAVGTRLTEEDV